MRHNHGALLLDEQSDVVVRGGDDITVQCFGFVVAVFKGKGGLWRLLLSVGLLIVSVLSPKRTGLCDQDDKHG